MRNMVNELGIELIRNAIPASVFHCSYAIHNFRYMAKIVDSV